jgi:hypothetical protein
VTARTFTCAHCREKRNRYRTGQKWCSALECQRAKERAHNRSSKFLRAKRLGQIG